MYLEDVRQLVVNCLEEHLIIVWKDFTRNIDCHVYGNLLTYTDRKETKVYIGRTRVDKYCFANHSPRNLELFVAVLRWNLTRLGFQILPPVADATPCMRNI